MRKNQRGLATADFLFSMVLAVSVFILLMTLSSSLVVVEVAQYIAFSSSRAFAGSHNDPATQKNMAQTKFNNLIKKSMIGALFSKKLGWFELSIDTSKVDTGMDDKLASYYDFKRGDKLRTTGLSFNFNAKLLNLRLPFLGSTAEDENTFKSSISGMINREPSMQECLDQVSASRYDLIINLDPRYKNQDYSGGNGKAAYVPLEDNGC